MIDKRGRKYTATMIGIGSTVGVTALGFLTAAVVPDITGMVGAVLPILIGAIAAMVATFITGNSAISFAVAQAGSTQSQESRTVTSSTSRTITDRRDADAGVEPSP